MLRHPFISVSKQRKHQYGNRATDTDSKQGVANYLVEKIQIQVSTSASRETIQCQMLITYLNQLNKTFLIWSGAQEEKQHQHEADEYSNEGQSKEELSGNHKGWK